MEGFTIKKIFIIKKSFECEGNLNMFEVSLFYFDCFTLIHNQKKLFKRFSINIKSNKDVLRLKAKEI